MRYFFDIQDGEARIPDDEGMILPNVEAAREEAAMSLAELAKDRVRERRACSLAIEVRDE
jgi:UDP-N-acetylenolpyruvoylglucosamine reductase